MSFLRTAVTGAVAASALAVYVQSRLPDLMARPRAVTPATQSQLANPQQPGGAHGQPIDGISCDAQEGQRIHIHQHLTIIDRGKPVAVPAAIGIPQGQRCIYWLHTHTPDGIIHIEAPLDRSFTLGDFFKVWGQPLTAARVASVTPPKGGALRVWVNDKRYTGDPRKIALNAHTDIVIEAGPPFVTPPKFTAWNGQ